MTPDCAVCGKPITFYMHQRYGPTGMVYYHIECCPEDLCRERREENNAVTVHLLEGN